MAQCTNGNIPQMSSNNSSNVIAIPFCYPGGVTFTFQQAPLCPCPSPNGVQTAAQYVQQPTQQLQQQHQLVNYI